MAVYTEIRIRRDKAANWEATNPRLALGEIAADITNQRLKVGNGIDRWNELPYVNKDLYDGLDSLTEETAEKIRVLSASIDSNKSKIQVVEAQQKITAATLDTTITELRSTAGTLGRRIDGVQTEAATEIKRAESEAGAKITNLKGYTDSEIKKSESRSAEKINDASSSLTKIAESAKAEAARAATEVTAAHAEFVSGIASVKGEQATLSRRNETLSARVDEVISGATEDGEILDARVDADGETHKTLGENVRGLQEEYRRDISATREGIEAVHEHLQEQADQLGYKLIRDALARAHMEQVASETARYLQEQIDTNAYTAMKLGLILSRKANSQERAADIVSQNADVLPMVNASCRNSPNGTKQFAMLCMTDLHGQVKRLNAAIKYLNETDAIDCACQLGDAQNNYATENDGSWYTNAVQASSKPFYTAIGNHDVAASGTPIARSLTAEQAFQRFIKPTANKIGKPEITKPYYRVDWDGYGITLIVLCGFCAPEMTSGQDYVINRGNLCYGQAQVDWLIGELGTIPAGNALIILQHWHDFAALTQDSNFTFTEAGIILSVGPLTGMYGSKYGEDGVLQDIIEAWKTGTKLEREYECQNNEYKSYLGTRKVSCNYTNRGEGEFACWVVGHAHKDNILRSRKYPGQLVIALTTMNNSAYQSQWDTLPRISGTKSEDAITVLSVDKESKRVNLVRVGSNISYWMQDRTMTSIRYDLSNEEASAVTAVELSARITQLEETLQEIIDGGEVLTYKGAKIATSSEVNAMMKDVFEGDGTGGEELSEIPDSVKDEVATQAEFNAMLAEIFG